MNLDKENLIKYTNVIILICGIIDIIFGAIDILTVKPIFVISGIIAIIFGIVIICLSITKKEFFINKRTLWIFGILSLLFSIRYTAIGFIIALFYLSKYERAQQEDNNK